MFLCFVLLKGEVVFKSLAELKARNITLRIVQNSVNNDTGYLMTKGNFVCT